MRKRTAGFVGAAIAAVLISVGPRLHAAPAPDCVTCHDQFTPQAVMDWRNSRHAEEDIGCDGCHKGDHRSARDVGNLKTITAQTCGGCHERQMQQFASGKHAKAWEAAQALPTAHALPMAAGPDAKGCASCHKIGLKSETEVGRLKSQGSLFGHASCDSCHTRHMFSVNEARQPQACQTCHMGFDHPQWEMYSASKHGVRALLKQNGTLPANTPAPRCQDCHMANGDHAVRAPWGFFGVRLPLPDDPQWRADQLTIMQALGLLDAAGAPTLRLETARDLDLLRMSEQAFEAERERMFETCNTCHSGNFVRAEFERGDDLIREADRLFAAAIRVVAGLYTDGTLPRPAGSTQRMPDLLAMREAPSPIERRLFEMHLEHRLRAIQGAFHSNPDHSLARGFSRLAGDLADIEAMARNLRGAATKTQ